MKLKLRYTTIIIIFALLLFAFLVNNYETISDRLPYWLSETEWIYTYMGIIILIYESYVLWSEDFFKKPWKEKNYVPILVIIACCWFVIKLWMIRQSMPVFE